MKEILKEVYQHCQDMQKIAETKNAGLIAFNGAISLAIIKILIDSKLNCLVYYYLIFVLFCLIVSLFLNFIAISAQLIHKEQNVVNHKSHNLIFFGTIANFSAEEYLKQIKSEYNLKDKTTKFHLDQSKQIVINAQIALRKFKLFNAAFKWTIAGIATPISILVYLIFFDNNK
jgi:hypothetical protein